MSDNGRVILLSTSGTSFLSLDVDVFIASEESAPALCVIGVLKLATTGADGVSSKALNATQRKYTFSVKLKHNNPNFTDFIASWRLAQRS